MLKRTMIQVGGLKGTVKYIAQAGQKKEGVSTSTMGWGQRWANMEEW